MVQITETARICTDRRCVALFYMLFVLRCSVACRSCSILKSSIVKLRRIIRCIIYSSLRYLAGGDRRAPIVSHIPLHCFRTFGDSKQAARITSATLNMTLMPSHKKQSQMRSNVSHGSVRVMAHKNQSVIYRKRKNIFLSFFLQEKLN